MLTLPNPYNVNPISRLWVDFSFRNTTRLYWSFNTHFLDREPWSIQIQIAEADDPNATWTNVGSPVVGTVVTTLADNVLRLPSGKELLVFYRIQLTAAPGPGPDNQSGNVYYSDPANIFGDLPIHTWLLLQEITRKETLRMAGLFVANQGYLLKQKRSGTPCPTCTDEAADEFVDADCVTCWGTGFVGGYWAALSNFYFDTNVMGHYPHVDAQRGSVDDSEVTMARVLADPYLSFGDVFVDLTSDRRFRVHNTTTLAQFRAVPVVSQVELRMAPFSDQIYQFPVPSNS